jgi:hypothetical protein
VLREVLTNALSEFESKQPVADWMWQGWRPWPVLRMRIALSLHGERAARGAPSFGGRLAASLRWRRQRLRRFCGEKFLARPDRPADIVFLTVASRCQQLGRAWYNPVVDPWAEAFGEAGFRVSVWDGGDPHGLTHVSHASVQRALDLESRPKNQIEPGPVPEWFETLADWVADTFDADIGWCDFERDLRGVESGARCFEAWLRRAAPKRVVLDCWYVRESMALALAAHRLEIPVVDLQHGVQGHGHPAYAGWSPPPAGGYEVCPDHYWVWGDWDAESLVRNNPGAIDREDVSVTGQQWLSRWNEGVDPRYAAAVERVDRLRGGARAILVTLQPGVPIRETLIPLIAASPREWRWWVRVHGRMGDDAKQLEVEFARATQRSVDVREATRLPLYALLRACSWHVTGFSTCALEALAFGVPTLLLHPSGEHAYADFVEQQVMWQHQAIDESLGLMSDADSERSVACRRAGQSVFAEPVNPRHLARRFLT